MEDRNGKFLLTLFRQLGRFLQRDLNMKRILVTLSISGWLILLSFPLYAATYYNRTDGGTAIQCSGTTDAAYPGSGTNQACAWSHPFWALDSNGSWKIQGGDTLFIYTGSYQMGFGAPNTSGWCSSEETWVCHLPPLPSGSNAQNPTRLLGVGWDSGCTSPPELWGTQRADYILSLSGTSNAVVDCLEITDHSGCVEFHSNSSVACQRNTYPYGDWAATGIFAADSNNVTLRHLNIHGLAHTGIWAGRLTNWTVEDVRISGNGWVGWDGDLPDDSDSNIGTLTFRRLTVEWSGCAESYPSKQPNNCWAQTAGGYGDGFGQGGVTGGHWVFEDCIFRYNTSDGIDLLYVRENSQIEIRRTKSYGNAGDQIKVNGSTRIENSLMVSNCGYFNGKSVTYNVDNCRAGGSALVFSLRQGNTVSVVNSTLAGHGDCLLIVDCDITSSRCNGTEKVIVQNNIFQGYQEFIDPTDTTCTVWFDQDNFYQTQMDYNVIYNTKQGAYSFGSHDISGQDPLFVNSNLEAFDGHLQAGSPAIDSGLPVGSLDGLIPSDDITGASRPYGSGVDRGAYEYGATPPSTETVSTPNAPSGPTSGATGISYTYSTGGSTSSYGPSHSVQYLFDWGDGTNSGWLSVGTTSSSKFWTSTGNYLVKSQARCSSDTSIVSSWSGTLSVTIGQQVCTYSIFPTSANIGSGGVWEQIVNVTAGANCPWTAESNSGSWDWLGISAGWNGTGNGTVTWHAFENNSANSRSGYLTVAGQAFTVTQPGIQKSGISIISPNGGENWKAGTTQTISWSYSDSPGKYVKIELLKGEAVNRTIAYRTSIGSGGSGSYSLKIQKFQTAGSDYKVRITSFSDSSYTDTSDNNFTISK